MLHAELSVIHHIITTCAIPSTRLDDSGGPDAHNMLSQFKHYNMQIHLGDDLTSTEHGVLMLVGLEELATFAEQIGRSDLLIMLDGPDP